MTENKTNQIYSCSYNVTMVPGAILVEDFDLPNNKRLLRILSIFWSLRINETVSNLRLALETQTTQTYNLQIGGIGGQQLSNNFANLTLANWVNRGDGFLLYEPNKQINFKNWFVSNNLPLSFIMANRDLLISYDYTWSLIIEVEDIETL